MTESILKFENEISTELKKEKPKKLKRPKRDTDDGCYVTNAMLLPEIRRSKDLGKVTPELAIMFKKIAERYAMSKSFNSIPYKEDMISEAVANLIQNGLKFDLSKSNPFSYYTQCCYHSFLIVIKEEKEEKKFKEKLMINNSIGNINYIENSNDDFREKNDFYGDY